MKNLTTEDLHDGAVTAEDHIADSVRAQLALEAGNMASFEWDIPGGVVHCGDQLARHFGLTRGRGTYGIDEFFAVIHPDDVPAIDAAVTLSMETGVDYAMEWRVRHPGGAVRWLGGRGRIIARDATGAALRMLGVNWDITEQKAQQQALTTMALEMEHRVKNAFAIMAALTSIAARRASDPQDMARTLREQIGAMGRAHSLARCTDGSTGDVAILDLCRAALEPWAALDPRIDIPADLRLSAQAAAGLSMLFYELTTNAAKYGGLCGEEAGLSLHTVPDARGGVTLMWTETLPDAAPRLHDTIGADGFGAILLAQSARMLDADLTREIRSDGLSLRLVLPPHILVRRTDRETIAEAV